ncbi:CRT10 Protein CRT10 [Candida maltosa Xu316]
MDSFQHFLQLRGIKRVRRQHRLSSGSVRSRATSDGNIRINTIVSNIRNENEVQASSSISRSNSDDEPLGIIQINNNAVSSHDDFYNTRSGSFGGTVSSSTSDDIDRSFEYITSGSPCHTMSCVNEDGDDEVDRFSFNVESKDFNDDMGYPMMMDHSDFAKILRVSPSDNFTNSLMVNHFGIKKLFAEDFRKFKNNLSEIVTDGDSEWLVLALNAELVFFGFDGLTNLPSRQILRLDTSPSYTSSTDRLISTWPYFPHTINYLKSGVFNGKHVLAACTDDGTLLIWYSQRIIELVSKFESKIKSESDNNTPTAATTTNMSSSTVIKPDFRMKMEASLWGLDFKTYNGHNIIVASDNSQSVVLFYYHPIDERFYHIRSHQILHNIPEVSIVSCVEDDNGEHTVDVSCCSISGEIIIFQFKFTIHQGPVNLGEYEYFKNESYYYVDGTMEQLENRNGIDPHELAIWKSKKFKRIEFSDAVCISRIVLSEDCWTIKPLDSKWFLPVGSIRDIFGDSKIDNTKELNRINQESKTLGQSSGKFQYFPSKTVNLEQQPQQQEENTKLTSIDDEYRRIHKELIRGSSRYLLVSSTARKLALFNFPSLYCPCSTEKVFNLAIPFNEESKFTNRISITKIIPELSCLIAVTQQGLITIMRLCTFNGIYGMRQEHVFPNALSLSLGYHGYRTIVGICLRDRSLDRPCFALYVTYNDGLILGYNVSLP